MMTEPNTARSGISTASLVCAALALAVTLLGWRSGSGILLLLGILASAAGLTLGIVATPKREASITISAVTLAFALAAGFGIV
jgi:hypothetical protein